MKPNTLCIEKVMDVQNKIPFKMQQSCCKRWWLELKEKQFTLCPEKQHCFQGKNAHYWPVTLCSLKYWMNSRGASS